MADERRQDVSSRAARAVIPVRTILATIGLVLLTLLALFLLRELSRVVAFLVVALFFTVVLNPAVDWLERRHVRRGLATALVVLAGALSLAALAYVFVRPIVDNADDFADGLPTLVEDARNGEGAIGRLLARFDLDTWVEENEDRIREQIGELGTPALGFVRSLFNTALSLLTILVLTILMLLRAPQLASGALILVPLRHRERARKVSADCAKAVSGYMLGNLLISLIAGVVSYAFLRIAGVPYPEVLALWVAFTDLIPLVGATLGAVGVIAVAFLDSTGAGIATVIFFLVYQQFENQVLQVTVMAKTVDVNPLGVLVAALAGVELFGLLGALLAIPAAGVIQVVLRDLLAEREGRLRVVPTVGADERPVRADGTTGEPTT